jgi:hypothetical protein
VLLSFAQFEREVTSERIGDKIAASKRKGQLPGALRVGSKGEMTAIPLIVWSSPNRRHQTRVGIRQLRGIVIRTTWMEIPDNLSSRIDRSGQLDLNYLANLVN